MRHLLVVGALAAVAGCGGDDAPAPTATSSRPAIRSAEHDARETASIPPEPQGEEPDKGTPGVQDATGGKIDVSIRGRRFVPAVMRLRVGQIVVFTDDDDVAHTVRRLGGGLPRSGLIPVGGRFEYTPLEPGAVRYR